MRNKTTKKNMDLDLRRYGNNLYSKAEQSGGYIESPDIIQGVDITPELLENEDILKKINNWGLTDEEIRKLYIITNIDKPRLEFEYSEDLQCTSNFSQCVICYPINEIWNRYNYNGDNSILFDYVKNLKYILYYSGDIRQDELKIEDEDYNNCNVLKKEYSNDTVIAFNNISSSFIIEFYKNSNPMIIIGVTNI